MRCPGSARAIACIHAVRHARSIPWSFTSQCEFEKFSCGLGIIGVIHVDSIDRDLIFNPHRKQVSCRLGRKCRIQTKRTVRRESEPRTCKRNSAAHYPVMQATKLTVRIER